MNVLLSINDKLFSLTRGEVDAISYLTKTLDLNQ